MLLGGFSTTFYNQINPGILEREGCSTFIEETVCWQKAAEVGAAMKETKRTMKDEKRKKI